VTLLLPPLMIDDLDDPMPEAPALQIPGFQQPFISQAEQVLRNRARASALWADPDPHIFHPSQVTTLRTPEYVVFAHLSSPPVSDELVSVSLSTPTAFQQSLVVYPAKPVPPMRNHQYVLSKISSTTVFNQQPTRRRHWHINAAGSNPILSRSTLCVSLEHIRKRAVRALDSTVNS
jgi:hypothetical protein